MLWRSVAIQTAFVMEVLHCVRSAERGHNRKKAPCPIPSGSLHRSAQLNIRRMAHCCPACLHKPKAHIDTNNKCSTFLWSPVLSESVPVVVSS